MSLEPSAILDLLISSISLNGVKALIAEKEVKKPKKVSVHGKYDAYYKSEIRKRFKKHQAQTL